MSYLTWVPGTKSGSPEEQQMVLSPEPGLWPCLSPGALLCHAAFEALSLSHKGN